MVSQIKKIIEKRKEDIKYEPETVYYKLLELVEQAIHARIIADEIWKYYWNQVSLTGEQNLVVRFSQVALDNFTVLQLWKLFDRKRSVFHVWEVAENLGKPALTAWLNKKIAEKQLQEDIKIIDEWRHNAIGHRSEAGYYAPDEHQKKFTEGRTSEKRLQDFLLEFLGRIRQELRQIPAAETTEGLRMGIAGFEHYVKNDMKKVFKNYEDTK